MLTDLGTRAGTLYGPAFLSIMTVVLDTQIISQTITSCFFFYSEPTAAISLSTGTNMFGFGFFFKKSRNAENFHLVFKVHNSQTERCCQQYKPSQRMQKLKQYYSNPSACDEKDPSNIFQTTTYAALEQNC